MRKKIYIAGHKGMVGNAINKLFNSLSEFEVLVADKKELNLLDPTRTSEFFEFHRPDVVINAAAKVGGIYANDTFPGEFIYENLMIQTNVTHAAYKAGVGQLINLGSACIYPKLAENPIVEGSLLTGALEPTNEPYAVAKIAGIKMCEAYKRQYGCDFRSLMPTNLYGPNDNYHSKDSHVVAALIRRIHEAKVNECRVVVAWGTGRPRREFMHVDDLAKACYFVSSLGQEEFWSKVNVRQSHLNIGSGELHSIADLAAMICDIVGYQGRIVFDDTKPDGVELRGLSCNMIEGLGWSPEIKIKNGLKDAYDWFLANQSNLRC